MWVVRLVVGNVYFAFPPEVLCHLAHPPKAQSSVQLVYYNMYSSVKLQYAGDENYR